jgi:cell division transport system permease protein
MHLTTMMSVSLVLFLIGVECVVLISARELVKTLRENVTLTVLLKEDAGAETVSRMQQMIASVPYILDSRYISPEEALQEHVANLGEDPAKFLGFNPLSAAFEIHLNEVYTQPDSIQMVETQLTALPYVDKVIYQVDIVNKLDRNLNDVSMVLLVVAAVLLILALVLISNTIQLQIYSKRFLINTMRLVGATPWVIKWPFIRRNIWMGVEASCVACAGLALVYYYAKHYLGVVLFPLNEINIAFLVGVVVVCGLFITFFASLAATNKYIRMKTNKLYEI